ncbi:MAG: hypothetical protein AAFQ53_08770 [Bacteroidota bacterium]
MSADDFRGRYGPDIARYLDVMASLADQEAQARAEVRDAQAEARSNVLPVIREAGKVAYGSVVALAEEIAAVLERPPYAVRNELYRSDAGPDVILTAIKLLDLAPIGEEVGE